jgi:predicted DCC family thiol-disulfide oxidoreductase YuxK
VLHLGADASRACAGIVERISPRSHWQTPGMAPPPARFVFDGDCGFCRKWAAWVQRRADDAVEFAPYQSTDLTAIGLTAEQVTTASYFVDPAGRTFRGNRSFARVLRSSPTRRWRLVGTLGDLPVVRWPLTAFYRWVVAHRNRLPAPPARGSGE